MKRIHDRSKIPKFQNSFDKQNYTCTYHYVYMYCACSVQQVRQDERKIRDGIKGSGNVLGRRSDAETSVQIHPSPSPPPRGGGRTKGGATICTNQRKRVESRKRGENFRGNIRKSSNASSRRSGNVISPADAATPSQHAVQPRRSPLDTTPLHTRRRRNSCTSPLDAPNLRPRVNFPLLGKYSMPVYKR